MSKERTKKIGTRLGWAAAGMAGLLAAAPGAAIPAAADGRTESLKQRDDGCPQAAAAGALKTIASAQTDYNTSTSPSAKSAGPVAKKKAAKKAAKKATKKAMRKTAKKAAGERRALKIRKKAAKKTAKKAVRKRAARRNPC